MNKKRPRATIVSNLPIPKATKSLAKATKIPAKRSIKLLRDILKKLAKITTPEPEPEHESSSSKLITIRSSPAIYILKVKYFKEDIFNIIIVRETKYIVLIRIEL